MAVFNIHHITHYEYDRPVKESVNQIRIFPVEDSNQQVTAFELAITGKPKVDIFTDYFGNKVGDFTVLVPHTSLSIDSRLTISIADANPSLQYPEVSFQQLSQLVQHDVQLLGLAHPERIEHQQQIDQIIADLNATQLSIHEAAMACNTYVFQQFQYQKGITTIQTTVDEILSHRSGVCQDFAHVLLQMLRTLGVPARYVSGYICPNKSGLRGEGATHAWIEYYLPQMGWVGLDPTNNIIVQGRHVKLGTGYSFTDCSPVKGTFKGIAKQTLSIFVSVGYEDGHRFEDRNNVQMQLQTAEGTEAWQAEYLAALQQQQQQQQ
ncbi:MAG: transglutaminase family protein [Bacteroidetes bacterium]|nr:MAG: transglutaminase family protein [Bacteroidota bacterium]